MKIPKKYVILDEISGTIVEEAVEEGEKQDLGHAHFAAADEEYSDSEEEEEEEDKEEDMRKEETTNNVNKDNEENGESESGVPEVGADEEAQSPVSKSSMTSEDSKIHSQSGPVGTSDGSLTGNWNPWPEPVRDAQRRALINPVLFQSWLKVGQDDDSGAHAVGGAAAAIASAVEEAHEEHDEKEEEEDDDIDDEDALQAVEALLVNDMFNYDDSPAPSPMNAKKSSSIRKSRSGDSESSMEESVADEDGEDDEGDEAEDEVGPLGEVPEGQEEGVSFPAILSPSAKAEGKKALKENREKSGKSKAKRDKKKAQREAELEKAAYESKLVERELSARVKRLLAVAASEEKAEKNDAEVGASQRGAGGPLGAANEMTSNKRRQHLMTGARSRTIVKLTIMGTQVVSDVKGKDCVLETAIARVNRLVSQVRQREPPSVVAIRHQRRYRLRKLIQERSLDLKKRLFDIQVKFQKRRKARLHELMTRRLDQLASLNKTESKLQRESAKALAAAQASNAPKLPKVGRLSHQSRRAVQAAEDAQILAAARLKQVEEKNTKESENFQTLSRKYQAAYDAERSKVMERILAAETKEQGKCIQTDNDYVAMSFF